MRIPGFLLLLVVLLCWRVEGRQSDNLVCSRSYPLNSNRSYDVVNCRLVGGQTTSLDLSYECQTKLVSVRARTYTGIECSLTIVDSGQSGLNGTNVSVYWGRAASSEHRSVLTPGHESEVELDQVSQTTLLLGSNNTYTATFRMFNIYDDRLYRICYSVAAIAELSNNTEALCGQVENVKSEEHMNPYMSLLVIGVILVFYVVVFVVNRFFPAKFESIDEILSVLPSKNVEALKMMVETRDYEEDEDEEMQDDQDEGANSQSEGKDEKSLAKSFRSASTFSNVDPTLNNKGYRKRRQYGAKDAKRIDFNLPTSNGIEIRYEDADNDSDKGGQANPAFEQEPDSASRMSQEPAGKQSSSIMKSRRRFSLSVRRASAFSIKSAGKAGKGNVKFANEVTYDLDESDKEELRAKIYAEKKRRASIKPYRRAYGLGVSSSDDSD